MTPRPPSQDITRIALAVLFIGLIIFASLWVLWPLMAATVWATMIVVATWPMMRGQIETAVRRLGEDLGIDRVVDAR
jgi:predicted PurR-regulated permease PerM